MIRARDEEASIGAVLDALAAQDLGADAAETIVVDSGSTDATIELARARAARLIEIPPESFSYGGALNTGCEAARGTILVALSAHAKPPDRGWLERMLEPFADPRVACAYGCLDGPGGEPLTAPIRQDLLLAGAYPQWGYSNGSGAFRAELWREHAFRADLPACEDKEWARHWLARGFVALISPALAVEHDHSRDGVRATYQRSRREWQGHAAYLDLGRYGLRAATGDWWRARGGYRSLARARASPRNLARVAGRYAAARNGRVA